VAQEQQKRVAQEQQAAQEQAAQEEAAKAAGPRRSPRRSPRRTPRKTTKPTPSKPARVTPSKPATRSTPSKAPKATPKKTKIDAVQTQADREAARRQAAIERQQAAEAQERDDNARAALRPKVAPVVKARLQRYHSFVHLLQEEFNVRLKTSPSDADIHKAHVRCLAKLHPDKYRQSSIQEQVEAEEMYKALGNVYDMHKARRRW